MSLQTATIKYQQTPVDWDIRRSDLPVKTCLAAGLSAAPDSFHPISCLGQDLQTWQTSKLKQLLARILIPADPERLQ